MSREHGMPSFFVTLTANDAWKELLAHVNDGQGSKCPLDKAAMDRNFLSHQAPSGKTLQQPVAATVAFMRRSDLLKKRVLHDPNGPLGKVVRYWYRFEFQKRACSHGCFG